MPTYQYACTACEHRFDAVQAFSDASLTECPECGQRLRKLYGSVGVVFKGSGFYRNDSRSSTSTTDAPAAAKDASPAKSESTAKSESSTSKSSESASKPAASSSSSTSSSGTAKAS